MIFFWGQMNIDSFHKLSRFRQERCTAQQRAIKSQQQQQQQQQQRQRHRQNNSNSISNSNSDDDADDDDNNNNKNKKTHHIITLCQLRFRFPPFTFG